MNSKRVACGGRAIRITGSNGLMRADEKLYSRVETDGISACIKGVRMIAVREKIRVESLSLGGITKAALLSRSWGKSAFYNWEILSFSIS